MKAAVYNAKCYLSVTTNCLCGNVLCFCIKLRSSMSEVIEGISLGQACLLLTFSCIYPNEMILRPLLVKWTV